MYFRMSLLSRRSRQRKRLSALVLSICSFVCLFVCLLVCLSPKCKKTRFSQKLSNSELWCLLSTYRKLYNWAFQRTHYWIPKIQDSWDPPSWKSTRDGGPIWIKVRRLVQNEMSISNMERNSLDEFNDMSFQSHLPRCRVLPPGEFNVMIPELRVTLQGAATWWIHCHDSRATCHIAGCKNSICHSENRFSPYFIFVVINAV